MTRARLSDQFDDTDIEARLDAYLRQATPAQWRDGYRWYRRARYFADNSVAAWCGGTVETGAGIIAALSPQASWEYNCEQAENLALGESVRNTAERLGKATAIRDGADPLDTLGGPKTRAFYRCILEPDTATRACIDRHMIRAGLDVSRADVKVWTGRAGVYEKIADAVERIAERYNLPIPTIQAVIWVVVR
jgi:hypothetical protein